jgi:hypothetical protein
MQHRKYACFYREKWIESSSNRSILPENKGKIRLFSTLLTTKKIAAKKNLFFSSRKHINQVCLNPVHHENSRCRKTSCTFVMKKYGSNLQDAVSS